MLASKFRKPQHCCRGLVVMSADLEGRRFSGFKVLNQLRVLNRRTSSTMLADDDERALIGRTFRAGGWDVFSCLRFFEAPQTASTIISKPESCSANDSPHENPSRPAFPK